MALTCKLSNNILRTTSCGYSLPEVTDIFVANYSEDIAYDKTDVVGGCGEEITGISGATFYHIEPAKNSTTFEDALVVEDSGNKYRTHTLTFNISGTYDACMHQNLDDLALGRFVVVVKTAEGKYLILGRITGLEAETATLSGGGDTNGLQIVLSANTTESAIPLSDAAVEDVLDTVPED